MGVPASLKQSLVYKKLAGIKEFIERKLRRCMPARLCIVWQYRQAVGRWPNLTDPRRFTEKLQWLKLYGCGKEYASCADKYEARNYVRARLGESVLTKLLAVYDKAEVIDFNALPVSFVLKCTHSSGQNIICKDKSRLDPQQTVRLFQNYLKSNYYWEGRESCYKYITPRVIAEEYLQENGAAPVDYKFLCFNGEPKVILVCTDRQTGVKFKFFDLDWKLLPVTVNERIDNSTLPRPQGLSTMIDHARKLSAGIPFVRVDFYNIADKVYFGEMTFYPGCGFDIFYPDEFDFYLGGLITLPPPVIRNLFQGFLGKAQCIK